MFYYYCFFISAPNTITRCEIVWVPTIQFISQVSLVYHIIFSNRYLPNCETPSKSVATVSLTVMTNSVTVPSKRSEDVPCRWPVAVHAIAATRIAADKMDNATINDHLTVGARTDVFGLIVWLSCCDIIPILIYIYLIYYIGVRRFWAVKNAKK